MLEFKAEVKDGVIVPPANIGAFVKSIEGKTVRILLGLRLNKRSLRQNNYYKGVVVPRFGEFLRKSGCETSDEQADYLLKHWVGFTRITQMPDGVNVKVPRSTTELDTKEMSDFTEAVVAEIAVRFKLMIPLPDDGKYGL